MTSESIKGKAAICGVGITPMGKIYGHDAAYFAQEAVRLAIEDAGLKREDIDGVLVNQGTTPMGGIDGLGIQNQLMLNNLRFINSMNSGGATALSMVQFAAMAVVNGLANHVVCLFADAPLSEGRGGGEAYGFRRYQPTGMSSLPRRLRDVRRQPALRARRRGATWRSTALPTTTSAPSPSRRASGRS